MRSTGCSAGTSWMTRNEVKISSVRSTSSRFSGTVASVSKSARSTFTPVVWSHSFDQAWRSRPLDSSSADRKSDRSVFPYSCRRKYPARPSRNSPSPTHATSWRSTDAPFAYVIPSKFVWIDSVSGMSATMGCVDGSWSW